MKLNLQKTEDNITEKNREWFNKNEFYSEFILKNETYKNIKDKLDDEIENIGCLLDIGNGGVFNYETSRVKEIYAIDLFFDEFENIHYADNIHFKKGNALSIPYEDRFFDGVVIVSLLHHLVGEKFIDIEKNISRCFDECFRVLKPGGKIIVHEPCIPSWFLLLEKVIFSLAKYWVRILFKHPFAIQLTSGRVADLLGRNFKDCKVTEIKKKGTLIHFGMKFPASISPVKPFLFAAHRD